MYKLRLQPGSLLYNVLFMLTICNGACELNSFQRLRYLAKNYMKLLGRAVIPSGRNFLLATLQRKSYQVPPHILINPTDIHNLVPLFPFVSSCASFQGYKESRLAKAAISLDCKSCQYQLRYIISLCRS